MSPELFLLCPVLWAGCFGCIYAMCRARCQADGVFWLRWGYICALLSVAAALATDFLQGLVIDAQF